MKVLQQNGKFIRQKCYLEEIDGKMNITCAGLPKTCYDFVEWEKFKTGFTCGGKLTFKHVKGGVKLIETEFTLKDDTFISAIEKVKNKDNKTKQELLEGEKSILNKKLQDNKIKGKGLKLCTNKKIEILENEIKKLNEEE